MRTFLASISLCALWSCSPARAETGIASVYANGADRHAGTCTANWRKGNCERVDPNAFTAAHKSLPIGTMVEVINRRNGHRVTVRINDRGPFVAGRIIDLTPAGAAALGFPRDRQGRVTGLAPVTILR